MITLSHDTALEYYRRFAPPNRRIAPVNLTSQKWCNESTASRTAVCECRNAAIGQLERPLHLLISKENRRAYSRGDAKVHALSGQPLRFSFCRIPGDCLLVTPEICFLQLGESLSVVQLVMLGYELCGTYSLTKDGYGFSRRDISLTDTQRLGKQLSRLSGRRGYRRAQRALRYISDASASPMETALAMLLCLPVALGGYGLPQPVMNRRIELRKRDGALHNYYVCDLYWEDAKLALEYDSDRYHASASKLHADAHRRNDLEHRGVRVITVTSDQIMNAAKLEGVARMTARQLGRRVRGRDYEPNSERDLLRKTVLQTTFSASDSNNFNLCTEFDQFEGEIAR